MQPLARSVLMLIQPLGISNDSLASDALCVETNLVRIENGLLYSRK